MRLLKYFLASFLFLELGFLGFFGYRYWSINHPPFISRSITLSPDPPRSALTGRLENAFDHVFIYSRGATAYAPLTNPALRQGESLKTDATGSLDIIYTNFFIAKLAPNSSLAVVAATPQNFLINQTSGSTIYDLPAKASAEAGLLLSIRSLHLLTQLNSGKITLAVSGSAVTVKLNSAAAALAYEDLKNVTHLINLSADQRLVFNDSTRTYRLYRR